jgi:hypothetical protein
MDEQAAHSFPLPAPEPDLPEFFAHSVPTEMNAPSEAQESFQPVQTLEERGDAMLFEIDALQGTPFDQAVVMPFE